jgi:hypothetical protein
LDGKGITSAYYPQLLSADPLATGSVLAEGMDSNRYEYLGQFPYLPPFSQGDSASTQSFSIDRRVANSTTTTSDHSYSVGVTVSGGLDVGLFKAKLTASTNWTWSSSSSSKMSTGSGSTDSFTVGQPAFGYTGGTNLYVYEDKIYKTYAFALSAPPTPSCNGLCGGQHPSGCWCDTQCEQFGDCCADKIPSCGSDSCAGSCGASSTSGSCFCDGDCAAFGDCCFDAGPQCGF